MPADDALRADTAAGPPPGGADGVRLDVRGLEVRLGPAGPDVVSEVSFTVQAGQVLGLVGESGSGKTTVVLALLGHARRGLRISSGEVEVDGVDLLRLPRAELRAVRGARVAYVPQDPSAALNPTLRVGTQLREAVRVHPGVVDDPRGRILEVLREVAPGRLAGPAAPLPPSALRRPAAAGRAGDGLRLPAVADRARRAHHRSRRVHPAPRTGNHPQPVPGLRRGRRLREPRPRGGGRAGQRSGGDVLRADHRDRPDGEGVRGPGAPVHPRAARRRALAARRDETDRDRRPATAARPPPAGLLVRPPLRLCHRSVPVGETRACLRRRPRRPLPSRDAGQGGRRRGVRRPRPAGGARRCRAGPVGPGRLRRLRPHARAR